MEKQKSKFTVDGKPIEITDKDWDELFASMRNFTKSFFDALENADEVKEPENEEEAQTISDTIFAIGQKELDKQNKIEKAVLLTKNQTKLDEYVNYYLEMHWEAQDFIYVDKIRSNPEIWQFSYHGYMYQVQRIADALYLKKFYGEELRIVKSMFWDTKPKKESVKALENKQYVADYLQRHFNLDWEANDLKDLHKERNAPEIWTFIYEDSVYKLKIHTWFDAFLLRYDTASNVYALFKTTCLG